MIIIKEKENKKKIKKNKRIKSNERGWGGRTWEENRRDVLFYFYFLLFVFFSDLRKSDRKFLSEQKAKLVYAARAMYRYQYLSLLSNFKR